MDRVRSVAGSRWKAAGLRFDNFRCWTSRGKEFFRGTYKIQNPHEGDFDFVAGEGTHPNSA
jgi:hypothetical protein